ncbi:tRNA (adenosine(37)-N6)-threonylcarbamoyltransferase complex transferase subunit TsaD [Candidatus Hydrogenosomobacter endosymbioticus]|nr:tRNA (adenosine(37)-N6)-threonylcarbamoyltransferase complex transferase subunit TsaD [Candidatus Hydrogenosomobacter endosymbioticus]
MFQNNVPIIGIETSCDETAVAVICGRSILSNEIYSQTKEHEKFGGVVPEVAARAHVTVLTDLFSIAIGKAGIRLRDACAIGVTSGPGLVGGLLVGTMFAKGIAIGSCKPVYPINHLEAHALTVRMFDDRAKFPYLLLLISGGHCQVIIVNGVGKYQMLGATLDDSLGECFDKVARLLGFSYPGGPKIEKAAVGGDPFAFDIPEPLKGSKDCLFSFSGLKTACASIIQRSSLDERQVKDFCASFQRVVADHLCRKILVAVQKSEKFAGLSENKISCCVIAGGVASNAYIRERINFALSSVRYELVVAPSEFCTDNAVMIAWAALERMEAGVAPADSFSVHPRWPIGF